ncbi:MAG: pyridoxal-phosphate dependent enzyme [Opitutus sp.]
MALDLTGIRAAHERIKPRLHNTAVLTSSSLNARLGAQLFFKCENFQKTGSFKARGALNAVFSLTTEQAARGVATHSSGNHGAAVAWAASLRGIPCHVVMPQNSSRFKIHMAETYGARLTFCEPTSSAREAACQAVLIATGASLIHPFADERVIAGQATASVELMETVPDLNLITCPVGGGGLLAGTAVAAKLTKPSVRVIATEPGGADDTARSFASGQLVANQEPRTIADGLRANLGRPNFDLMVRYVDEVSTVSEAAIEQAMRMVWETLKILIEPSAAVPVAALLERRYAFHPTSRIGIILTGGNIDLDALPWPPRPV